MHYCLFLSKNKFCQRKFLNRNICDLIFSAHIFVIRKNHLTLMKCFYIKFAICTQRYVKHPVSQHQVKWKKLLKARDLTNKKWSPFIISKSWKIKILFRQICRENTFKNVFLAKLKFFRASMQFCIFYRHFFVRVSELRVFNVSSLNWKA